ncbi:helix-turn-helix transcriptional regulator [Paenibacillus assamensis]|uniref:helix-turn-helix transcriptional regulator n=1 Tax=Paenibacillus assamensis TaxID=311244 RepID=UPI000423F491|nr:AraC family transcriptional regulator [Paenibacillus assamensis]
MEQSPTMTTRPIDVLFSGHARHSKAHNLIIPEMKHYLIRLQLEGSGHTTIDGTDRPIKPGSLLLLKPGDYYNLKIGYTDPERLIPLTKVHSLDYYLIINGPMVEQWWDEHVNEPLVEIDLEDRILAIWREIMMEHRLDPTNMNDIVEHLTYVLFRYMERTLAGPELSEAHGLPRTVLKMKQFIEQSSADPFTIRDVAEHVQLSESRASHLFKGATGKSIMDYAIDCRLNMACERILHGYMSLEQIAEMCGFQSYTYFHRTFKKRLGLSPSQYREQRTLGR